MMNRKNSKSKGGYLITLVIDANVIIDCIDCDPMDDIYLL
jgi:hypothetical protein